MRGYKQASESGLRAEVDHKSPMAVYTHASWVQSTWKYSGSLSGLLTDI